MPALFPAKLQKNFASLREKFDEHRGFWQELELLQTLRDCDAMPQLRAAGAVIAQQLDIIDENIAIGAPQSLFDLRDRYLFENLCARCAQKPEQQF